MKHIKNAVLATTGVDARGRSISEPELRKLFGQMPDPYILNQEHDLSKLPAGIGRNKRLTRLKNGLLAIQVDLDLYDESLETAPNGLSVSFSNTRIVKRGIDRMDIQIRFNPDVIDLDDIQEIVECSTTELGIQGLELEQKGLDQEAIIVISFLAESVARGFLEAAGSELYRLIKQKLLDLIRHHRSRNNQKVVCHFVYSDRIGHSDVEIVMVADMKAIERLSSEGFDLDTAKGYAAEVIEDSDIRKIVIELQDSQVGWELKSITDSLGKPIEL